MGKWFLTACVLLAVAGCGDIEWFPAPTTTTASQTPAPTPTPAATNSDSNTTATAFVNQCGIAAGTLTTSNAILVTGVSGFVSIGVSSGSKFAVNGGPFGSVPGSAASGDTVRVQHTSGTGVVTTTLTIDAATFTFKTDSGSTACSS